MPRLFTENNPIDSDIRHWWKEWFPGRDFQADWFAAEATQRDLGDAIERTIVIDGMAYVVNSSFTGCRVEGPVPERPKTLSGTLGLLLATSDLFGLSH